MNAHLVIEALGNAAHRKVLADFEDAKQCLGAYIDNEYKQTIGISFTELFHGSAP